MRGKALRFEPALRMAQELLQLISDVGAVVNSHVY